MNFTTLFTTLFAAAVAASASAAPTQASRTPLEALKAAFNERAGTVRVLTVLSPT